MSLKLIDLYNSAKQVADMFPKDMSDDGSGGFGWKKESIQIVNNLRKTLKEIEPLLFEEEENG